MGNAQSESTWVDSGADF